MSPLIESLLWKLGATSVQTAVLTLAVWALCRGVKRLPATTQTWLWWLVGVQAVVGLLWNAPLQLPVLPAHTFASALGSADALVPMATATAAASTAAAASATAHAMDVTVWSSWATWLFAVWAAGVLVISAGTLRAYWRSRALVRAAQPCTDEALVQSLQMAAEAHGLLHPPALRLSSQIDSPQLIGPWRPVLLLPAKRLAQMADDDLDMALTHELIHLRRRDLWWGCCRRLPSICSSSIRLCTWPPVNTPSPAKRPAMRPWSPGIAIAVMTMDACCCSSGYRHVRSVAWQVPRRRSSA